MCVCGSGRFVREILLPRTLPCLQWFQSFFYHGLKRLPPQSQWPRGIRRRSAALLLLGLRVRISPRAWISFVSCQVEVCTTVRSLVQRSPTEGGVSCV